MKALIVGGGSVGRFIAEQLGATGHSVVGSIVGRVDVPT